MGLDITAYQSLTKALHPAMEDGCPVEYDTHFHAHPASMGFTEENWPGHSAGVEPGAVYTFENSFGFRAGSYSGYNHWRRWLAEFAGWPNIDAAWAAESGPFFELINFADNEGVIGPKVAAKLAKDFADNQERADMFAPQGADEGERKWWTEQYANWRKSFEMAADNGAVEFH